MKKLTIITLSLIFTIALCEFACAQNYSKFTDVQTEQEYTDNFIDSVGVPIQGSGLNKMWFQVNEDSLTDSVIYSTDYDVTLPKQGNNTIRVWVSDNAGNVSDTAEISVIVDSKPPYKVKFTIK